MSLDHIDHLLKSIPPTRPIGEVFDPKWMKQVVGMFYKPARKDRSDKHLNSPVVALLECGHMVDMSLGRAASLMARDGKGSRTNRTTYLMKEFCHTCLADAKAQARPEPCQEECPKCDDSKDLEKWLDEKIPWRRKPGKRGGR